MGISRPSSTESQNRSVLLGNGKRNFTSDVLKIEISGPNRTHFSILDLPGIFQSLTKDLTEPEKVGVRKISADWMAPEESIIMLVLSTSMVLCTS